MSESTTTAAVYSDASGYWKLCSIVLGIGFVIAVASHAGPNKASAYEPNMLTQHQAKSAIQATQSLSIGGFDSINGQPAFIIINQNGQRVGTLPMMAMSEE